MYRSLGILILCSVITGCISDTAKYQEGKDYFQSQQYNQAFSWIYPVAEDGNPDAMYAVGYMYYYGKGVIEDHKQANYWMYKAAQCGQLQAISALSMQQQIANLCPNTNPDP